PSLRRAYRSLPIIFLFSKDPATTELYTLSLHDALPICRLDTPIIFIEARINLSRFVVTGCAAKTSATVTFPSLNLISLLCALRRSEERFSRNAETDLVCRLLLEKKKDTYVNDYTRECTN